VIPAELLQDLFEKFF